MKINGLIFVDCNANCPVVNQILPKHSIIYKGIIEIADTTALISNNDIKVGFVLVRKNEVIEESNFIETLRSKIETRKDIIWSEPFKINE